MLKPTPPETTESSDADLMGLIASGDMASFASLIRRHQQRVRALAYRITRHPDAADDITQEAFLRVLRGASRYSPTAAFTTWLHRIVVNLCLDRTKRPHLAPLNEEQTAIEARPGEGLSREERVAAVRREIDALPERQRIALMLHRFEGQTHAQISEMTGWSTSAVEALLVRAYAQLRERLKSWQT